MLGDDVIDGTKKGVGIVGHALGNAARGALLFAAIAVVATVAIAAVGTMLNPAATGFVSELAAKKGWDTAARVVIEGFAEKIFPRALSAAAVGATGGALVAGIGSLLPGSEEGFSLRRLFSRKPKTKEAERAPAVQETSQTTSRTEAPVSRSNQHSQTTNAPSQHTIIDNSQHTQTVHNESPSYHYQSESSATSIAQSGVVPPVPPQAPEAAPAAASALPDQPPVVTPAIPADSAPKLATPLDDSNPLYKPGLGAQMMQRGNDKDMGLGAGRV